MIRYILQSRLGKRPKPKTTGRTKMSTIAQKINEECSSAADVMERSEIIGADTDQDWENETTTYTFDDGSKIVVSGPSFEVLE